MDSISKELRRGVNWGIGAYAVGKIIDQTYPSANAKLEYKSNNEMISYYKERDAMERKAAERRADDLYQQQSRERQFREEQAEKDRRAAAYEASEQRYHEEEMQRRELRMREEEAEVERERIASQNYIAELNAETLTRNADRDRGASIMMHNERLEHERRLHAMDYDQRERLARDNMRLQQNIADQQERLQKYLLEQGHKNTQEIERFKALATRETQILLARENAANQLQDRLVQEALKTFPLNISPLVLLKNKPDNLTNLLRFTVGVDKNSMFLPDVANVYVDVKNYAKNPEALNIFIAPLHISSSLTDGESLAIKIWDVIYQNIERFFTLYYNRRGDHPVIFFPTAWKDNSSAGQHASETLHFFLKDIPCIVVEPRFDGHFLNLIISGWSNGYISTDQVRVNIDFKLNLYADIAREAYARSVKSLSILDKLGDKIDESLKIKKEKLKQNIDYYKTLDIDERIENDDMDDIEALGIYDLFDIEPSKDLNHIAESIASIICINLAVLADVHHLQTTDVLPLFPKIFKEEFPEFFENIDLKEQIAASYERVLLYMRLQDIKTINPSSRIEFERMREMQITNMRKDLALIDSQELSDSIDEKLRRYAYEKYGLNGYSIPDLWNELISRMALEDIPFYNEILPNIEDRLLYKRIDKKIADLQR